MNPKRSHRRLVPAGVVKRRARGGRLYLRFRATVYEDQIIGGPKPVHRVIAATRDICRQAADPWDWRAALRREADYFYDVARVLLNPHAPLYWGRGNTQRPIPEGYEKQ